jgi:pilus assembly protein Flp/PilA
MRRLEQEPSFAQFLNDEPGATAIEYGLIVAGISIAIASVVNALGSSLNATFNTIFAESCISRGNNGQTAGVSVGCRFGDA